MYKRQIPAWAVYALMASVLLIDAFSFIFKLLARDDTATTCLLYTSDAADERSSVDLGGRRIITKKTTNYALAQPVSISIS